MAFSDDAIGFYLQLEDQLSPALATAASNYEHFTREIDKFNKVAYKSASKGFGAVSALVNEIGDLPNALVSGYKDAIKLVGDVAKKKAIKQKVVMEIDAKSNVAIGKSVAQAVVKALKDAKIRLSATFPLKKSAKFDTTVTLKAAYKDMVQPPDMVGVFQGLPRFAEGGMVEGAGKKGEDSVLAMVAPGEMVVPADVVDQLKSAAAKMLGAKGDVLLDKATVGHMKSLIGGMEDLAEETEMAAEAGDELTDPKEGSLGTGSFLSVSEGIDNAREALQSLGDAVTGAQSEVSGLFGEMDENKLEGFQEGTRNLARSWGMGAEQLTDMRNRLVALSGADIGLDLINEAQQRLVDSGAKNVEQLEKLAVLTAAAAKGGLEDMSSQFFLMSERAEMSQDQIARVSNQLMELNQQTGLGADAIGDFATKLTEAATDPSSEAAQAFAKMGIHGEQLTAFLEGDAGPAIEQYVRTLNMIANSDAPERMAEMMGVDIDPSKISDFRGNIDELLMALDEGTIQFDALGGGVAAATKNVSTADTWFSKLSNQVGKFAQKNFGPLIEMFEEFNPMVLMSITQLGHMATSVLPMLANPIGLAVAGVAALVGGLTYLAHKTGALTKIVDYFREKWVEIKDVLMSIWDALKMSFMEAFGGEEGMEAMGQKLFDLGKKMIDLFIKMKPVLVTVAQVVGAVVGTIFKGLVLIADAIVTFLLDPLGETKAFFYDLWLIIKMVFQGIWDSIVGFVGGIWDMITGFFGAVWEFLGLDQLGSMISDLFGMIVDMIMAPINLIKWAINTLIITPINWVLSWDPPLIPGGTIGEILGIGEITPFAEGGIVTGPTMGLVGEEGPEAIIPLDQFVAPEELRAYVDNAEVVAAIDETNELLRKILAVTGGRNVAVNVTAPKGGGLRGNRVSAATRMIGEGDA